MNLCIICGASKKHTYSKCGTCGFDPSVEDERQGRHENMAKSIYLSHGRYYEFEDWMDELKKIQMEMKLGQKHIYDEDGLSAVRQRIAVFLDDEGSILRSYIVPTCVVIFVIGMSGVTLYGFHSTLIMFYSLLVKLFSWLIP